MSQGTDVTETAYLQHRLKPGIRIPPEDVRRVVAFFEADNGKKYRARKETKLHKHTIDNIWDHWKAGRLPQFTPQGQRPRRWQSIDRLLQDARKSHPELDLKAFASTRAIGEHLLREVCRSWDKRGALQFVTPQKVKFL